MTSIALHDLVSQLDAELNAASFKDYCPNGLQLESHRPITKIVAGVTANEALIDAAINMRASAILVHHGLFWKGEDGRLTGFRYARVRKLIEADVALIAYHLPLDAHPTLGNNAQLASRLGLESQGVLSAEPLVLRAKIPTAQLLSDFANHIEHALARKPLVIGDLKRPIRSIALCTGAAQSFFEHAVVSGVDAYLTGEISEQHVHIARETGVAFIAAGHHATERYGVQALARWMSDRTGLAHEFVDIDSPV